MKLPVSVSGAAQAFFARKFSAESIFLGTMLCFPAFLFQKNVSVLALEAAVFFILTLLRRGKVNIVSPIFLLLFITLCSLLSPHGKVLFRAASLPVTEGALVMGLQRALTLIGMVFISQFAISPNLSLPGKAGAFLAGMFSALDKITAKKIPLKPATILSAIDDRLYESYFCEDDGEIAGGINAGSGEKSPHKTRTTALGWILMFALAAALYGLLLAQ